MDDELDRRSGPAARLLAATPGLFASPGAALVVLGACIAAVGFLLDRNQLPWGGVAVLVVGYLAEGIRLRREPASFALSVAGALQLGLLVVLIQTYKIEGAAFYEQIAVLIFFGYLAHHHLQPHARLPAFTLLSIASLFVVLGPVSGAVLLAGGLGLLGLAHLPAPMKVRVGLIGLASAALAAVRLELLVIEQISMVLPILASMFMFRLIIYLYDLNVGKGPKDAWSRLAYFFMLPNVVFPFFPVVDYSVFGRTYSSTKTFELHQRGFVLILVGVFHLILYRVDNYYLLIGPEDVTGFGSFLHYIATNFGLYLRISGLFHLIVGLLHLFGFALPDTHTRYYFSFSFTEFWRRINIYWKDFMQKLFFNPTYMRLHRRKVGHMKSIILSMVVVFFMTWLLHAYAWFWLRGSFLWSAPDVLFWTVLAALLILQTLYEARAKTPGGTKRWRPLGPRAFMVLRTAAGITTICVLWSLWSAESFSQWLSLMAAAAGLQTPGVAGVEAVLRGAGLGAFVVFITAVTMNIDLGLGDVDAPAGVKGRLKKKPPFGRTAALTAAGAGALVLVQQPAVYGSMSPSAQAVVLDLRSGKLSARENAAMVQGYYENLTDVKLINSQLWESRLNKPRDWRSVENVGVTRPTGDWLDFEIAPNAEGELKGARFVANRWGMRDKDYEEAKPAGVRRIALVGASRAMGSGVQMEETFAWRLEDRLKGEQSTPVEVLNFGVGAYEQVRRLMVVERKAFAFDPDVVIYVAYNDLQIWQLVDKLQRGVEVPYPEMKDILREAGAEPEMSKDELTRRLKPFGERLARFTFERVVKLCEDRGVLPVLLFLAEPSAFEGEAERAAQIMGLAREAGFEVLDLSRVYEGHHLPSLWVADWDHHPNPKGHLLVAERLYEAMLSNPAVRERLGLKAPASSR